MSNKQQATPTTPATSVPALDASLNELHALTLQWAHDRNLIEGSTFLAQSCKLLEELGEVATGLNKSKPELVRDGVGDMLVVLTIMEAQALAHALAQDEACGMLHAASGGLLTALANASISHANPVEYIPAQYLSHQRHVLLTAAKLVGSCGALRRALCGRADSDELERLTNALASIAQGADATLTECWAMAYAAIKDRKGRMENGVFIKEEDLQRAEPQAEPCVSVYAVPAGDLT